MARQQDDFNYGFEPEEDNFGFEPEEEDESLLEKWDKLWINQPTTNVVSRNIDKYVAEPLMQDYEKDPSWSKYFPQMIGGAWLSNVGHGLDYLSAPLSIATLGVGALGRSIAEGARGLQEIGQTAEASRKLAQANKLVTAERALSAPQLITGGTRTYQGIKEGDISKTGAGLVETVLGGFGAATPRPKLGKPGIAPLPEGLKQLDLGLEGDLRQPDLPIPPRYREAGDRELRWMDEPYLPYKEGPQQQGLSLEPPDTGGQYDLFDKGQPPPPTPSKKPADIMEQLAPVPTTEPTPPVIEKSDWTLAEIKNLESQGYVSGGVNPETKMARMVYKGTPSAPTPTPKPAPRVKGTSEGHIPFKPGEPITIDVAKVNKTVLENMSKMGYFPEKPVEGKVTFNVKDKNLLQQFLSGEEGTFDPDELWKNVRRHVPFSERPPRQPLHGGEEIPKLAFQPDEGVASNRDWLENFLPGKDVTNPTSREEINQQTEFAPEDYMNEVSLSQPTVEEEALTVYAEKDPQKIVQNLARYTAEQEKIWKVFNAAQDARIKRNIPVPDEVTIAFNKATVLKNLAQAKYERAGFRAVQGQRETLSPGELINKFFRDEEGSFDWERMKGEWARLREKLGREPTPEDMEAEAGRISGITAPRPGEPTGNVAPFKGQPGSPEFDEMAQSYDDQITTRSPIPNPAGIPGLESAYRSPADVPPPAEFAPGTIGAELPFEPLPTEPWISPEESAAQWSGEETPLDLQKWTTLPHEPYGVGIPEPATPRHLPTPIPEQPNLLPMELRTQTRLKDIGDLGENLDLSKLSNEDLAWLESQEEPMGLDPNRYPPEPEQLPLRETPESKDAEIADYLRREDVTPPEMEGGPKRRWSDELKRFITEEEGEFRPGVIGQKLQDFFTKKEPGKQTAFQEAVSVPTAAATTLDLSMPGRQGWPLIFTPEYWKASWAMLKSLDPAKAAQIDAEIKSLPVFQRHIDTTTGKLIKSRAEQVGMKLIEGSHVSASENDLMSNWIETGGNVPYASRAYRETGGRLAKISNRAAATFLNHLRANTTQKLFDQAAILSDTALKTGEARPGFFKLKEKYTPEGAMELNPYHNLQAGKDIADVVNTLTGRGPLRTHWTPFGTKEASVEGAANVLKYLFFSPRNIASKVRMMNPLTYTMASPFIRKQYLKGMMGAVGAWYLAKELFKLNPEATVEEDNTSSDYGKIRIGNTRLDPGAGFLQYYVAWNRFVKGGTTSSATGEWHKFGEGFRAESLGDMQSRFFVNKLSPLAKLAYDWEHATEYLPVHVKDRTAQLFVPLIIQDFMELKEEDPRLLWMMGPVLFGMGTQTYSKGESVSKLVDPENDVLWEGGGLADIPNLWR